MKAKPTEGFNYPVEARNVPFTVTFKLGPAYRLWEMENGAKILQTSWQDEETGELFWTDVNPENLDSEQYAYIIELVENEMYQFMHRYHNLVHRLILLHLAGKLKTLTAGMSSQEFHSLWCDLVDHHDEVAAAISVEAQKLLRGNDEGQ